VGRKRGHFIGLYEMQLNKTITAFNKCNPAFLEKITNNLMAFKTCVKISKSVLVSLKGQSKS
jgi:hypothetical protein